MALGLMTLFFLVAFTLFYLGKSLENKPDFLNKAVEKITDNLDHLALWGLIYSLLAILLAPLAGLKFGFAFLVSFVANLAIFLMVLPLALENIATKYQDKINTAVLEEARRLVGWITGQEKYLGYVGAVVSFLLFVVLFR
jgi:hypothetical protein